MKNLCVTVWIKACKSTYSVDKRVTAQVERLGSTELHR